MALSGAYRLPKDIGEIALQFIKDGMDSGQALYTARVLSDDPEDTAAQFYAEDLVGRLDKAKARTKATYPDVPVDPIEAARLAKLKASAIRLGFSDRPYKSSPLSVGPLLRRDNTGKAEQVDGKTYIPRVFQIMNAQTGAERRLVAEVANAVAAGDRIAFLEILAELGFRERIARPLADRYAPETIEYNPAKEKRIKWPG